MPSSTTISGGRPLSWADSSTSASSAYWKPRSSATTPWWTPPSASAPEALSCHPLHADARVSRAAEHLRRRRRAQLSLGDEEALHLVRAHPQGLEDRVYSVDVAFVPLAVLRALALLGTLTLLTLLGAPALLGTLTPLGTPGRTIAHKPY